MNRLSLIIEKADRLGMVVMLGIFYFGQDERIKDEAAVKKSLDNTVKWVLDRGYRNVLIEVANGSNNNKYVDYRKADEPFEEGYQTMPVDWGINSARKKGFLIW